MEESVDAYRSVWTNGPRGGDAAEVAVVAAVNDPVVLRENLARSTAIASGDVPLVIEVGHKSASLAYNTGRRRSRGGLIIYAHQDVFLPQAWLPALMNAVTHLNRDDPNWAVLGVFGKDASGVEHGRVWSTGLHREVGKAVASPIPVVSIDELVIVVRVSSGLWFDEQLPGFHLYGTDIVQQARSRSLGAYVFDGPCIHNSLPVRGLDSSYWDAHEYMRHKWAARLPIPTSTVPLTNSRWPRIKTTARFVRRSLLGQFNPTASRLDPGQVASHLGYDGLTAATIAQFRAAD